MFYILYFCNVTGVFFYNHLVFYPFYCYSAAGSSAGASSEAAGASSVSSDASASAGASSPASSDTASGAPSSAASLFSTGSTLKQTCLD